MESCPQKEHINRRAKILFRHEILSIERTQKLERQDSLLSWNLVHRMSTETAPGVFTSTDGVAYILLQSHLQLTICSINTLHLSLLYSTGKCTVQASAQYRQVHSTGKCTALLRSSWFHFETVISVFRLARKMTTKLLHQNSRFSAF